MTTMATRPRSPKRKGTPRPSKSSQMIYSFSGGRAEGRGLGKDLLGGKGANLAEMCGLGLPVPPRKRGRSGPAMQAGRLLRRPESVR